MLQAIVILALGVMGTLISTVAEETQTLPDLEWFDTISLDLTQVMAYQ